MSYSSILRRISPFFILAIFFTSCDKDFNEIGTDIVGEDHFGFEKDSSSTILAFNRKTGAVATNDLDVNPLGIFNNGKFGKTTANFVGQVNLVSVAPTFVNVTEDRVNSVTLRVPYFSTLTETDSDGLNTYELDSVYGNLAQKMRLKIYENGYYLRDFDPASNSQLQQKYYSDQGAMFDNLKIGSDAAGNPVVGGLPLNNLNNNPDEEEFQFFADEVVTPGAEEGDDEVRETPGMNIKLNPKFFHKKIFMTNSANLVNNNVFENYFRGLYFKIEEIGGAGGAMAMLDFSKATITINYEDDVVTTVNNVPTTTVTDKKLVLNFSGNNVTLLENTSTGESSAYDTATGNPITGDSKLYLKGGNGSVAYIDLFGGGNSFELEELRANALSNNWLVNEAYITFNVEQTDMESTFDPNRIYLYDATNERSLVDYVYDTSTGATGKPKYGKTRYGGIAELTGTSGSTNRKAKRYKIRITEHIKNVIFKDSTNVRLGLGVTETIANSAQSALKNVMPPYKSVPKGSVMSPLGTILTGTNVPADNPRKIRLVITYTKPD